MANTDTREIEQQNNRLWAIRFLIVSPIIVPAIIAIALQSLTWMVEAFTALKIALGY